MPSNYLRLGAWNAICDSCGRKFKSYQLRKRWDGFMVCEEDFEIRHPQTLLKVQTEHIAPPWVRPQQPDRFAFVCDLWSTSPMADFGEADCMTVGGNTDIELLIRVFNPYAIAGIAIASRSISGVVS